MRNPSTQNEPNPERVFGCSWYGEGNHVCIEVNTGNLRWLAGACAISMEEIEHRGDRWYSLGGFTDSPVTVEMTSSFDARLTIKDRNLETILLNGKGCYAIKTDHAEFPIEGDGNGLWEILDY